MSDAERGACLAQREPQDKDRRAGAEPQAAPLCLVSDRTASWEWESGERRRGLSPRYRLGRLAPGG